MSKKLIEALKSAYLKESQADEKKLIEIVAELLNKGEDINQKDEEGKTALTWATEVGFYKVVHYLIEKGVDVNARNKNNDTPLFWACARGRTEIVKLFLDNGSLIDEQDKFGYNALMFAAMYGHVEATKALIENGANLDLKNKEGKTALDWAKEYHITDVIKLLSTNEDDWKYKYDTSENKDVDPDKYKSQPFEGKYIEFKDFNFKLAVIQILMYEEQVLKPKFDIWEFANLYTKRKIDIEEEGYDFIPEVNQYFQDLKIDEKFASLITELFQDGGNDIYGEVIAFWDGEDDAFNIQSAEDAKNFPNLKKVTLFSEEKPKVKNQFQKLGIAVDYL